MVSDFHTAREILRSPYMRQAGTTADDVNLENPDQVSVFFLDGEQHKTRRGQLARFFTPKAIRERHHRVMEDTTAELIAEFRATGRAQIDIMSMRLACDVTAEIVGLTESDPAKLSERLRHIFRLQGVTNRSGLAGVLFRLNTLSRHTMFNLFDVQRAARARRRHPKDDVISHCVELGYTGKGLLIECLTYATAGMLTTRELIAMVALHLFENEPLRAQFLMGDEAAQFAILDEILRLEPVTSFVYRKATRDFTTSDGTAIKAGELFGIALRGANTDEQVTGDCPFTADPGRAGRQKMAGNWMSFGDGPHRCPGAQVALYETRIFIDALFRVPGIRLTSSAKVGWCAPIQGYEVHGAVVECDQP
jgi:cytochrome P450